MSKTNLCRRNLCETNRILREARSACLFPAMILLFSFLSCGTSDSGQPVSPFHYASFRDIPGVTEDEAEAIEALREQKDSFVYGITPTTEAFYDNNGEIKGYATLFCAWLTELLGIPFRPVVYEWGDLIEGLETGKIDFSGDLSPTDERRRTYFMTSAIAQRTIKYIRLNNSPLIADIAAARPLRLVFFDGSITYDLVSSGSFDTFEAFFVSDNEAAYNLLESGKADAILTENVLEAAFDVYGEVTSEDFFPMIYSSVSLTTKNSSLKSVISVVQKALQNNGLRYLTSLYSQGQREYLKHKLFMRLSEEEKAYIQANLVVSFAAEIDNYPVSFYNVRENLWQGVALDVVAEIQALTGLTFKIANDQNTDWPLILKMLEDGRASMVTELIRSEERKGRFLWPDSNFMTDFYALLSKLEFPDITPSEILYVKVGVHKGTAYADLFKNWFPDHEYMIEYENMDAVFDALDRGEVDLVISSRHQFLTLTNFRELPGYKINISFDRTFESTFGFNKNEATLCSIVDKALSMIDTKGISGHWVRRTFDYRVKLAQTRMSWVMGTSALLLSALTFIAVLFVRNRRTGRQLELRTTMLSTIYKSIPDLLYSKDLNGVYTSCNPGFEEMAGMPESQVIGKTYAEIAMDEEFMEEILQSDISVIKNNTMEKNEVIITYPDGSKKSMEMIKTPLLQSGEIIGILGIARDITDHKKAQEAVLAAARAKGTFLAQMSHEIRTPLNAVIGMSYIVKDCVEDNEKALRSVNQIITSSHHLLGVLNDILDMSKIESGKLELTREPFSLLKACGEVADIMIHRCVEKSITFVTNIQELKDITLAGDKLRLNQVLINLLGNAVKFTGANGEIKFIAEILEENAKQARVKFSVSDTGIGMSEEQIEKLFVPFEQTDATIAARFGGTGLGLSLSQNFVTMMGGTIRASSEPDKGSSFVFALTFDKGELPASQAADEKHEAVNLSGKRMLLAEDIEINRLIICELLSVANITIDEVENGRQAVDVFNSSPEGYYDVIMMDIQMPILDGYEAAKEIRALDRADAQTVPIIAMTAHAYKEDVEQALTVGMDGHLAKPIDKLALMETVEKIMQDREG